MRNQTYRFEERLSSVSVGISTFSEETMRARNEDNPDFLVDFVGGDPPTGRVPIEPEELTLKNEASLVEDLLERMGEGLWESVLCLGITPAFSATLILLLRLFFGDWEDDL
jgi:hypothetical protein